MTPYERKVQKDLLHWEKKILKKSSLVNRMSKRMQTKVQAMIPEKVQRVLTETIKKMTQVILFGSNIATIKKREEGLSLAERDILVEQKLKEYTKVAVVEGAGTGAGGILLGLADFPLLLGIKIKFLFDAATLYGFDTKQKEERLFILHVFQLAFSSDGHRHHVFKIIDSWDEQKHEIDEIDWEKYQIEYRDYIDFIKMLQLVPGIGAVVGAYANYQLLDRLGEYTMNCYRIRILKQKMLHIGKGNDE
jgi:EcsC protein family